MKLNFMQLELKFTHQEESIQTRHRHAGEIINTCRTKFYASKRNISTSGTKKLQTRGKTNGTNQELWNI